MKKYILLTAIAFNFSLHIHSQNPSVQNQPIFYLDSIRTDFNSLNKYIPDDIAFMSIYKDSSAVKIAGDEAKNGLVFAITKKYAREKYWNLFCSLSPEYIKAVPSVDWDKNVVYFLNDKVIENNVEGTLYNIDRDNIIEIKVISKKQIKRAFNIQNKTAGIMITTKKTDNK